MSQQKLCVVMSYILLLPSDAIIRRPLPLLNGYSLLLVVAMALK